MDIEYLRRFVLVGQTLNFRRASEILFISQPTLSHSISSLEEEVGVPLLIRNTKSVKLTPTGEKFLQASMKIIKIHDDIISEIAHTTAEEKNILNIGYVGPAFGKSLTPWIKEFKKSNPEVEINVSRHHGIRIQDALDSKAIQLAIMFKEYADVIPDIKYEKIAEEKFMLVLSSDHPLANRKSISLKEMESEPLILCQRNMSPYYYDTVISFFNEADAAPHVTQEVHLISDIYRLVDMELGYAIMSLSDTCFYDNFNLKFIEIEGVPEEHLIHSRVIAWKGKLTESASKFKNLVINQI